MSISITGNTFQRQNPYLNKPENRQTVNNIEKVDNTAKEESTKSQSVINRVRNKSESTLGVSYCLGKDETGKRIIIYDSPMSTKKTNQTDSTQNQEQDKKLLIAESNPENGKPEKTNEPKKDYSKPTTRTATSDTSKVDAEIKKLKEKKQQIQQEIRNAHNDENKRKNLEVQLARVEFELRAKDNDAYRRQQASVTFDK